MDAPLGAPKLEVDARRPVTLGIAVSVHALAMLALWGVAPRPAVPDPEPPTVLNGVELDLMEVVDDARPGPKSAVGRDLSPGEPPRARSTSSGGRVAKIDAVATSSAGGAPSSLGGVEPLEPQPGDQGSWSFSPSAMTIDPRAAVTADLVAAPGPRRAAEGEPPASTTGGVAEGLAAHDVAIGLGRGGAILQAAEDAAREDGPTTGTATLEVIVGADGKVSVDVVKTTGEADRWARVAATLSRSADASSMRIPDGARGWRVVVQLDAIEKFPTEPTCGRFTI
jgi:hypothetical protein